jgi:hypothetical protein
MDESTITEVKPLVTYGKVQGLVAELGGTMDPRAGGYGGGSTWFLELRGKKLQLTPRRGTVNPLDTLYIPKPNIKLVDWHDFTDELQPDAFWRLLSLDWK